jgi:fumagillin biosynthesis methyltransferase
MAPPVKNIVSALDSLSADDIDDAERQQITEALRRSLDRLQSPFERAWEMTIAQPYLFAACQIGIDLGLWQAWRAAGGGEKTLDELLKMCQQKCDANLLRKPGPHRVQLPGFPPPPPLSRLLPRMRSDG